MHITWRDIVIRLAASVIAGALIGLNRDENGKPAGMRTTILVALSATLAMLQADLLLDTAGKTAASFAVLDLMRLPLGILSGIGFIGAGVIIRRGGGVSGVTTAASLWFVTVDGLCFGGGQVIVGAAALTIALVVLWILKPLEACLKRWHTASLIVRFHDKGGDPGVPGDIVALLDGVHIAARALDVEYEDGGRLKLIRFRVRFRTRDSAASAPPIMRDVAALPGVAAVRWAGGTGR